ncbi:MAG: RDD family protein [Gammaproteobacteria bacterium]|nr:RDD family protein [Gammaproteobacteria bacterium]
MKSNVSLLRRLGAISYDIILAFSLAFFIVGAILIAFFDKQAQTDLLMFGVYLMTVYFYFTWSWVKGRQTLGMKTWKFQIEQKNGDNITHKQAFVRFVLATLSFAVIGLGFIYQLINKDNLAWHDKHSNTYLIKN